MGAKIFAFFLLIFLITPVTATKIAEVEIKGEITEGAYITVSHAFEFAERENCDVMLIIIDTPGGVFSATQKIVLDILNSKIPVIAYVPKGALSASAGSIILISADIAAMANGTAVGAATPVMIDPISPRIENKTVSYVAGYVKDIARAKGRNAEVVEKFVTESLTLTAEEALQYGVIDVVADSREDLFKSLDGRTVSVGGQVRTLSFSSYEILKINKPIQASIYEVISNPQLATILLLLGIYLLIFGLTSPGMLAETAGAICLVLALAGLGVIGVNYLGLVLVVLGVIFLVAEIMTPTYGILGAASVICVTLGALILFQEPLMPRSFYETFPRLIGGIAIGMASIMTFLIIKISKLRKKESRVGEVVGEEGEVIEFKHGKGMAKVRGELWKIECDEELTEGDRILVIQRDGLKLKVKKVEENAGGRAEK